MSRNLILVLLFLVSLTHTAWGRELKLESFTLLPHDISARTDMREDYNGDKCALIKISLPIDGCKFEGGVVDSEFDVNEYRVYLAAGTKKLRIKCPGFDTLELIFGNHSDILSLESLTTYSMRIGGYEAMVGNEGKDPGVNYLIIYIDPENIPGLTVTVGDELRKVEDGEVTLCLPYGEYDYKAEAPGYAQVTGKVSVSKGEKGKVAISLKPVSNKSTASNIKPQATQQASPIVDNDGVNNTLVNVETLETASLTIHSELAGTRIKLNDRYKATTDWSGALPPGNYVVEATKEGHRPYSEIISIEKGENKRMTIPELVPILGAIDVSYKPSGATISVDGAVVGETPAIINNITAGYHTVTVGKKGYRYMMRSDILVKEGEVFRMEGTLEKSQGNMTTDNLVDASFPGGVTALGKQIHRKLNIPADTPPGRYEIPFELSLDEKGRIENIRITESKEDIKNLEEECRKVFKQLPPFNPAKRNGTPEKSIYQITIPVVVSDKYAVRKNTIF